MPISREPEPGLPVEHETESEYQIKESRKKEPRMERREPKEEIIFQYKKVSG